MPSSCGVQLVLLRVPTDREHQDRLIVITKIGHRDQRDRRIVITRSTL